MVFTEAVAISIVIVDLPSEALPFLRKQNQHEIPMDETVAFSLNLSKNIAKHSLAVKYCFRANNASVDENLCK